MADEAKKWPPGYEANNEMQLDLLNRALAGASAATAGETAGIAVMILMPGGQITAGYALALQNASQNFARLLEHGPEVLKMVLERSSAGYGDWTMLIVERPPGG